MGTPEDHRGRLGELNEIAVDHCAGGRYEKALALFELVAAGCTVGLGADDPDTLVSQGNLVVTQLRIDPRSPALRGLDANFAARRRVLGDQHPATIDAGEVRVLAYDRAADALERALAECTDLFGPDHPDTVGLHVELGELRARRPERPVPKPEPASGSTTPAVLPRQRPRGARFPRQMPDDQTADLAPHVPAAGRPDGSRRPRGARFPRER